MIKALIGICVSLLLVTGFAFATLDKTRNELTEKRNENAALTATVQLVNANYNATVKQLESELKRNDELLTDRAQLRRQVDAQLQKVKNDVKNLTRSDRAIADWANTPVPADISELLNQAPYSDGDGLQADASLSASCSARTLQLSASENSDECGPGRRTVQCSKITL